MEVLDQHHLKLAVVVLRLLVQKYHVNANYEEAIKIEYVRAYETLTYEPYINPVFLLQKRVLRAISIKHITSSSTPIFSDLKILQLHDLFQLTLLCFVHDYVNKTAPSFFHSFSIGCIYSSIWYSASYKKLTFL